MPSDKRNRSARHCCSRAGPARPPPPHARRGGQRGWSKGPTHTRAVSASVSGPLRRHAAPHRLTQPLPIVSHTSGPTRTLATRLRPSDEKTRAKCTSRCSASFIFTLTLSRIRTVSRAAGCRPIKDAGAVQHPSTSGHRADRPSVVGVCAGQQATDANGPARDGAVHAAVRAETRPVRRQARRGDPAVSNARKRAHGNERLPVLCSTRKRALGKI